MKHIPALETLRPKGVFISITVLIVASLVLGQIAIARPAIMFEETGTIMLGSFALLIATARINRRLFTQRRTSTQPLLQDKAVIWALISLGFLYLALDEVGQFHEQIDYWVHRIMHWRVTALSDRLDDMIIGLYALIGFGLIWIYKAEFHGAPTLRRWLTVGAIIMVLSIVTDALSNRTDILEATGLSPERAWVWHDWISIVEESCKLYAEACFLLGFISHLKQIKQQ
ncbi:hypothetical protein [Celeribacter sp. ULVN23_4]